MGTLGLTRTNVMLGTSATATNNFMLYAQTETQSIHIKRGNYMKTVENVITFDSDEVLYLKCGNLQFPATQVPSADPNTLDDYKEGTWTPTFSSATAGSSWTASGSGRYTKIGNSVFANFNITATAYTTGGSGNIRISLPPYTVNATVGVAGVVSYAANFVTTAPDGIFGVNGTQYAELYAVSGGAHIPLTVTEASATMSISGYIIYYV